MFFVIFWTALVRYTWLSNSSRFFFRQSVLSDVFGLNGRHHWQFSYDAVRAVAVAKRREYVSPLTDDSCTSHQQHFSLTWRSQGWCQGIVSGWFVCPVYLILAPASWGPRPQNHGNYKGWPRLRRIGESVSTSRSGDIGNGLTGHKSEARLLDNSRPSCISSSPMFSGCV